MRLLCPAIRPYAQPGVLPLPSTDIYATFGMSIWVIRVYTVPGMVGWRRHSSATRPELRHRQLQTPSRVTG
ncbi:hypothetical protein Bca4012_032578 [Brassica carinata]